MLTLAREQPEDWAKKLSIILQGSLGAQQLVARVRSARRHQRLGMHFALDLKVILSVRGTCRPRVSFLTLSPPCMPPRPI